MANVISDNEIAWLAGLMEGDGSFEIMKNTPSSTIPVLRISMLDKDIIERVAKMFGSNITTGLTPKGDKIMYKTQSSRRNILEHLLPRLYPYMGIRRKLRIDEMFAWLKSNPKLKNGWKSREVSHG